MAAPIYSQSQITAMMTMPKYVAHDAWQDRHGGRESKDEVRTRIKACPCDESDLTEFVIETCQCIARGEASFTLFGKLSGYPEHSLCRYEKQLARHTNPKWFPPQFVGSQELHRHVYNERAIRENWPWDKCAEPLNLTKKPKRKLTFQQAVDRLAPVFLDEINVEIHDPDVVDLLF